MPTNIGLTKPNSPSKLEKIYCEDLANSVVEAIYHIEDLVEDLVEAIQKACVFVFF